MSRSIKVNNLKEEYFPHLVNTKKNYVLFLEFIQDEIEENTFKKCVINSSFCKC